MIGQVPDEAVDPMQNADGEDSPVGSVDTEIQESMKKRQ